MRETTSSLQIPSWGFIILQKHSQAELIRLLGFWAPWFCIAIASMLLMATEHEDHIFRTISIGCITVFALGAHLLARDALHDPYHPDILLTIGYLMCFVIPPVIFATGLFDDIMFPHTAQVRSYFPHAILGVLIGQTFFNLPFCLTTSRKRQLIKSRRSGVPIFIFALGFVVLFVRFTILATGTYWHTHPSEFMFTPSFSPLAIFDVVGRIVTIYAAIRAIKAERLTDEKLAKTYLIMEITWHLFSGKRAGFFLAILGIIMALIFIRRKIPWRYVVIFIIFVLLSGAYLALYRVYRANCTGDEKPSIEKAMEYAFEKQQKLSMKLLINMSLDRLNDGQYAAGCFMNVPDNHPFLEGKTYKMIPWILIPRVIYPPRPKFVVCYNSLFRPWITWSSAPVTTIGEAYINFGWLGIPVVFLALGFIHRGIVSVFRKRLSYVEAAILIFYSTLLIRMMVNPAVSYLSWMLKILLLLAACRILERITITFNLRSFLRSRFHLQHPN